MGAKAQPTPPFEQDKSLVQFVESALSGAKISHKKELLQFAQAYFKGLSINEYEMLSEENILQHLQNIYAFLNTAWTGDIHVRVHNPPYTRHTVAEIHVKDQPFLVDTAWSEINRRGFDVHHTFHPVLLVKREAGGNMADFKHLTEQGRKTAGYTAESLIHIEFDRQEDELLLRNIKAELLNVMQQAYQVVRDFTKMTGKLSTIITQSQHLNTTHTAEHSAFLTWLLEGNFVFLGYRHYDVTQKNNESFFGMTKGSGMGILDSDESSVKIPRSFKDLAPNLAHYMQENSLVTVTKGLDKSPVHRHANMDYVGIKEFDSKGKVVGEHRFMGLFTSKAYTTPARDIPIVREKIQTLMDEVQDQGTTTHNYKALANILETYPRDELFQIDLADLRRISHGILHLSERQRVRMFVRNDRRERMISVMIYIPRDRMSSSVRKKIITLLMEAYKGEDYEYIPAFGESLLTRLYFKIRTAKGAPEVNDAALERQIVETVRSWDDSLRAELVRRHGEHGGNVFFARYRDAFREGYKENTPVNHACHDIQNLEQMSAGIEFLVNVHSGETPEEARLKVFRNGMRVNLSDIMPILDNMGLFVSNEHPNRVRLRDGQTVWLHEFGIASRVGGSLNAPETVKILTRGLEAAWKGDFENDSLNGLIVAAGVDLRQLVILRSFVAYLKQITGKYGSDYVRATLLKNAALAKLLVDFFDARFDPSLSPKESQKRQEALNKEIDEKLKAVSVLDEDIIIRQILGVTKAMLRTNAWQRSSVTDTLAYKIKSADVPDMPLPRPMFEIFVYNSKLEGIHLRGGLIARGGIRWSDRPEDFRTEVMGLMKTQMIKNAIIVPMGAKGSFIVKDALPQDRAERMQVVEARYATFITALLSVTDNLIEGSVVPPRHVVRYDNDDPYLVVAADKGTATFSDIANGLALNTTQFWEKKNSGFWMGDAFASGGSNGYDHKAMGITARGAWECVKEHFRVLGKDIQNEPFTAVGIGDMAGDVFGNGMLLSKHTRLIGAFNHMHIFIDPTPDAASSWEERNRLFREKHSQWSDYNPSLISKGGGVFNRSEKVLTLSPEIQKLLGFESNQASPNAVIRALLTLDVDLLWNGGIGTFVKGASESHADASDRTNNDIRVNGNELRAKVVGEGGNLGFTQKGRIDYALTGGIINTDAVDNSAGVDCSDHEVNIKILLNQALESGKLTLPKRNDLLLDMTDNVAKLVLEDNYLQAQFLTLAEQISVESLDAHARLIQNLAQKGLFNPRLESLPDEETLAERKRNGLGLMRPELATLLSYVKQDTYDILLGTTLPDDPALEERLHAYFPEQLRKNYMAFMGTHRLKPEIIATVVANDVVNRMGLCFIDRLVHETGRRTEDIVRAYLIASGLMADYRIYDVVRAMDNKVPATTQREALRTHKRLLEFLSLWLLRHEATLDIGSTISKYKQTFALVAKSLPDALTADMKQAQKARQADWQEKGMASEQAALFSTLPLLSCVPDIGLLALETKKDIKDVLKVYFQVGENLAMPELLTRARQLPMESSWQRVAATAVLQDLFNFQKAITQEAIRLMNGSLKAENAWGIWAEHKADTLRFYEERLDELKEVPSLDFAHFNAVIGQLRSLVVGR